MSPYCSNPQKIPKMNCKETLFDYITSIEAYPFSGVSDTMTMCIHQKHVKEEELGLDTSQKTVVPMKPKSGSFSEKTNIETAGQSYTVTVSWQIRFVGNDTYKVLEDLNEYPKHLILRTYGEGGYFIRCEENGYSFSYQENDGVMDCELTLHNGSGAQRII